MRVLRTLLAAAVGVVVAAAAAAAQDDATSYPNRPIKVIVPFAAGGTTDVLARIVGQALTAKWGGRLSSRTAAGPVQRSALTWSRNHLRTATHC